MINFSRRLEDRRIRLVQTSEEFNLPDAFGLLDKNGYGGLTQIEFRDAMIILGLKPDRVAMDRVYLFFRRYNNDQNDNLRYSEFSQAVCPLDQKYSYKLR